MDSPRDTDRTDRTAVLDSDSRRGEETGPSDRDLRDVLARLVVAEGDRADLSLREMAEAAGGADRLVPELLDALESEATAVRIGAAWALCALADDQPKAVEYLTERVAERMDGDDEPFEVGQVLSYLRGRYPGRVADALDLAAAQDSLGAPADDRRGVGSDGRRASDRKPARKPAQRGRRCPSTDAPARVQGGPDQGKRIETDGGVPAGAVADLGDGRQVVRPSGGSADVRQRPPQTDRPRQPGDAPTGRSRRAAPAPTDSARASTNSARPSSDTARAQTGTVRPPGDSARPSSDDRPRNHPTHPDFDGDAVEERPGGSSDATPARATDAAPASTTDPAGPSIGERDDGPETPETFAAIAALSSLDRLSAVDTGVEERYAAGYRCRAATEEEERGVAVRLFDRPDEGDRLDFRSDLEDCLARWQALADADSVVDVAEWGSRPRPWVRTQPVDTSLAARGRPSIDQAVDQAVDLAGAVADLHARGAVHGGLDPKNVVYPCDPLDALERPMLDNVGLMGVFREYFEPANYLDPRFAAPEYFDDDFGSVDAASDVYGLGGVVYYLVTGRPPFTGSYGDVRRGVLDERPPAPSEVTDDLVPTRLDTVLRKALAKRKIKRYDAVESMVGDLERVRDGGR